MQRIARKDFLQFIKTKRDTANTLTSETQFYLDRFDGAPETSWYPSWNWSAFFVPFFWLVYRRMYSTALLILTLDFALGYLANSNANRIIATLMVIYGLGKHIFFGLYGNCIYLKHVDTAFHKKARAQGVDNISVAVLLIAFSIYSFFIAQQITNEVQKSNPTATHSVHDAGKSESN